MAISYQNDYARAIQQIARAIRIETNIKENRFEKISRNIVPDFLEFIELTNGLNFIGQRIPIDAKDLKNLRELWALRSIFKQTQKNTTNRNEFSDLKLVIERIERLIAEIYARCITKDRNLPSVIQDALRTMRLDKKQNKSEDVIVL